MINANQLQFNLDHPVDPRNLKTNFTSPGAIMYERESPIKKENDPYRFKAVSHSKLSNAVILAKRDLKLAKRRQMFSNFARENKLSPDVIEDYFEDAPEDVHTSVLVVSPKPKRDKRPNDRIRVRNVKASVNDTSKANMARPSKQHQEVLDIKRLRLEIQQVILKLQKSHEEERVHHQQNILIMDMEEEQKLLVRHLEQMRKHSRTVYTLQQQVQVIKEELRRTSTKDDLNAKSRLFSKVAATHRGTSRLLQSYCPQLPEHLVFQDNFVAVKALFQEVSRLLKELSLCALQLNLAEIEEVERLSDALQLIEPKYVPPSNPLPSGRTPRTGRKKDRTPHRSFKSKNVTVVKKSFTKPSLPKPSFLNPRLSQRADVSHMPEAGDMIDRPEWRPPSNSPYKSVGPPSLGPLLDSPTPRSQSKAKSVKFFSTPREHDIDTYQMENSRDINALKNRLADELEAELKGRIQPLLKQVNELAKSKDRAAALQKTPDDEMLERQVREIVQETKQELENFQKEKEIEQEAVQLQQRPSLESLFSRLDAISQEEEAIRRRWREVSPPSVQINYEDTEKESHDVVSETIPKTPQAFKFTKTTESNETAPKRIVNFIPDEDRADYGQQPAITLDSRNNSEKGKNRTVLVLPETTLHAIEEGRRNFERHLKHSFHEPKGNFNPWKIVDGLSDEILDDVIAAVSREVNGMCESYADEIFKGEFADAPNLTDSSLMTSESSAVGSPVFER